MKVGRILIQTKYCLKKEKDSPLKTLYGQLTKFIINERLIDNKNIIKIKYHLLYMREVKIVKIIEIDKFLFVLTKLEINVFIKLFFKSFN